VNSSKDINQRFFSSAKRFERISNSSSGAGEVDGFFFDSPNFDGSGVADDVR
jgi:hypothetical protein